MSSHYNYTGHKQKPFGLLFFFVYTNVLPKGEDSNFKFFAEDTSIFLVVCDTDVTVEILSDDLTNISLWVHKYLIIILQINRKKLYSLCVSFSMLSFIL